jgi:hypothetical protein
MFDRINDWKRIYDSEENAITKALSRKAWDVAAFWCAIEMVRQTPELNGGKQLNGLVMGM